MYCYGEFERELEERTGHSIEDFMSEDYFIKKGLVEEEEEETNDEED